VRWSRKNLLRLTSLIRAPGHLGMLCPAVTGSSWLRVVDFQTTKLFPAQQRGRAIRKELLEDSCRLFGMVAEIEQRLAALHQ